MAKEAIRSTALVTDDANTYFQNRIEGDSFRDDVSLLSAARALFDKRLKEGETIRISVTQMFYGEDFSTDPIAESARNLQDGQLLIFNISTRKTDSGKWMETLAEVLGSNSLYPMDDLMGWLNSKNTKALIYTDQPHVDSDPKSPTNNCKTIEEVQNQYNRAATTLNKLSGELKHAESDVVRISNEIKDVEATCERLVKSGNLKDAEVYASRRSELVAELEQKKECISRLKPMVNEATQIYDVCGKKLRDLKRTRKETIDKLRMNGQLKDLLGDLDDLKRDTATSKMLDAVMEGSKDLQKEVDGARVVHENRTSTKIAKAEQKAAQLKNDEYLESLKKKYGGK